ncbi:MAG: hypothetical protein IKK25_03800 [Lentisphaeria bacterium]|nr:hypothetical protein [Lentisphaeria bacterium]
MQKRFETEESGARMEDTRSLLKDFLHHQGISHATLEFESASFPCPEA